MTTKLHVLVKRRTDKEVIYRFITTYPDSDGYCTQVGELKFPYNGEPVGTLSVSKILFSSLEDADAKCETLLQEHLDDGWED